jgi:hypothetical protein
MPRHKWDDEVDDVEDETDRRYRSGGGRKARSPRDGNEFDQAFKCGHCKQFIGAPISGGRQRNHCPNCLYSRHVDDSMPGDRKSTCGSLMKPIGVMMRRNGELVLIHECVGCGKQDPNRIAADDNPVLLEEIPVVPGIGLTDQVDLEDLSDLIPEDLRDVIWTLARQ